jgi:Dolichyl-phosphate-mannose-protein mannosyltransferase
MQPSGQGRRIVAGLAAIWIVAVAFDLGKAAHVDDTAYLEIAQVIATDPLHPMTHLLNWGDSATPIHDANQPHLLFYAMALVLKLAPAHWVQALHLLWVLFSGAAICLAYALARELSAPRPLLWTALLCLGPAFLPAQNLMVDVPLLALWLGFFLLLVRAEAEAPARLRRLALAGLILGAACLVKYSSLALLPIFALAVFWRAGRRGLWLVLVPLAVLVAWSILNWLDYGGVHLLSRSTSAAGGGTVRAMGVLVTRGALWLIALGATTPFSLVFVPALGRDRPGRRLLAAALTIAAGTVLVGRLALPGEPAVQSVLRGLFLANGALVAALALRGAGQVPWSTLPSGREPRGWLLYAWAGGAALFIVILSPFIAVRHVLLAIPALYLLIARGPDAARLSRRAMALGLALTAFVGATLAASDESLAEVYRQQAPALAARFCGDGARCVAVGHWGWQWYAARAGMAVYDRQRTVLAPGDRVIIPELPAKQDLRPADAARLSLLADLAVPASYLTLVRTIATEHSGPQGDRAGGYYYFWTSVPWTITDRPLDRFRVYDVGATTVGKTPAEE